MDSASSPDPFISAASEGFCNEIEMVTDSQVIIDIETKSNSAANNHNDVDKKELLKWDRIAIVLAFTSLLALLGVSYFSTIDGKFFPKTFRHTWSYIVFLMVINVAFYLPINGFILSKKYPNIGKTFSLISLVGLVLSFTILSWTMLPPHFNWPPWFFFIATFGVVVYHVVSLCYVQTN